MGANPVASLECVTQCVEDPLSGPKHREVCLTHCLQALNQNLLVKYNKINTERLKKFFIYILFMLKYDHYVKDSERSTCCELINKIINEKKKYQH